MAKKVIAQGTLLGVKNIRILFSKQIRAQQSAQMVAEAIQKHGLQISFMGSEKGLQEVDQGTPYLPQGYTNGEYLPCLTQAWDCFCKEAYDHDNLSYRFGSPNGNETYPSLEGKFHHLGESLLDALPRQYAFFNRLLAGKLHNEGELLVLICHNTTILILLELHQLALRMQQGLTFSAEAIPSLCWRIYCEETGKTLPENLAFGEMVEHDLKAIRESPLLKKLIQAEALFRRQHLAHTSSM